MNLELEYRKELKKHLMKNMKASTYESYDSQSKSPATDLVQSLFPTPSSTPLEKSRALDALLDSPVASLHCTQTRDAVGFSGAMFPRQRIPFICKPRNTYLATIRSPTPLNFLDRLSGGTNNCADGYAGNQTDRSNRSSDHHNSSYKQDKKDYNDHHNHHRSFANVSTLDGINNTPSVITSASKSGSNTSKNPLYRKRTSRELGSIVQTQCKIAESLSMVNSPRNEQRPPPISPVVLWKSTKRFKSSIDLRSGRTPVSHQSNDTLDGVSGTSTEFWKNAAPNGAIERVLNENVSCLDAEEIVRTKFTDPLIREVERVYVQNITTTADLLKKLERMPGDIHKALAKKCEM